MICALILLPALQDGVTRRSLIRSINITCRCSAFLPSPLDPWFAENETNRSFDLCEDSGASAAFFPKGKGAMLGTFEEVKCEGNWQADTKIKSESLWYGSCMANDTSPLWPGVGCGNRGTNHSLACTVMTFWLMYPLRNPPMSGWHKMRHGLFRNTAVRFMEGDAHLDPDERGWLWSTWREDSAEKAALLVPSGDFSQLGVLNLYPRHGGFGS
jgi:hypothetical protein